MNDTQKQVTLRSMRSELARLKQLVEEKERDIAQMEKGDGEAHSLHNPAAVTKLLTAALTSPTAADTLYKLFREEFPSKSFSYRTEDFMTSDTGEMFFRVSVNPYALASNIAGVKRDIERFFELAPESLRSHGLVFLDGLGVALSSPADDMYAYALPGRGLPTPVRLDDVLARARARALDRLM